MNEGITSSGELRQFASENSGRRKIDTDFSLDLHRRSANQIDTLNDEIAGLKRALATAMADGAPNPTPQVAAPQDDPSEAALLVLRQAQATAEQTLAQAQEVHASAERTKVEAEALATAKAEAAIAQARGEGAHLIEQAEARAAEVAAAAALEADRAAYAQRQYRERAATLRADAESIAQLAEGMEMVAGEGLPPALTSQPFTEPSDTSSVPALDDEPHAEADVPEPLGAPAAAPATDLLPPPPPKALIDLNERELEQTLGASIDDELFGDEPVIDLTDGASETADEKNFEFFSRDR